MLPGTDKTKQEIPYKLTFFSVAWVFPSRYWQVCVPFWWLSRGRLFKIGRALTSHYSDPLQYSWLEDPHGHRRPEGYSPRGHKESDMTEWLHINAITNYLWNLTRDQAQSLWSGSTDSKTLEYQRTNPREYQIVRTHTKETAWIQDPASLNHE